MPGPHGGTRTAALTFDDGPDPVWTPWLLDALARAEAKANFFVVAPLTLEHPELVETAVAQGHPTGLGQRRVPVEERPPMANLRPSLLSP